MTDPNDPTDPDNWSYGCKPDPGSASLLNIMIQLGQVFGGSGTYNWNVTNNGTISPGN